MNEEILNWLKQYTSPLDDELKAQLWNDAVFFKACMYTTENGVNRRVIPFSEEWKSLRTDANLL